MFQTARTCRHVVSCPERSWRRPAVELLAVTWYFHMFEYGGDIAAEIQNAFFSLFIRCLWPVNSANLRAVFQAEDQSEPSPRSHEVLTSTFQFFSKHRAYICRLSAILTAYIMLPALSLSSFSLCFFLYRSWVGSEKVETDSSLTTRCHWLDIGGSAEAGTRPRWPFGWETRRRTEHYSTTERGRRLGSLTPVR